MHVQLAAVGVGVLEALQVKTEHLVNRKSVKNCSS